MNKYTYFIYCLFFFVISCFLAKQGVAQESNLLRELRIPQIVQENPGARIPYSGHISIPGAGRVQTAISLPLNLSDIISISDNTLKKIRRNIAIENANQIDIINFGFCFGNKNYISVNATVKTDIHFALKKDIASFIIEGNAPYEGKTMSFLGRDFFSINAYAEFGVGYNREVNDNLSFGINAKYLMGLVNAYAKKAKLDLHTSNRFEELTLSHTIDGRFAGVINVDDVMEHVNEKGLKGIGSSANLDFSEIPQNLKNNGFALDFGAHYRINKWFDVNASVLDLGFIKWKTNTWQYNVKDRSFPITGYSYGNIAGENDNISEFKPADYLYEIVDSLENIFVSELKPSASYTKWLNAKINIGGSFYINEHNRVNAVFNGKFINGNFIPSGTISYVYTVGKWFDVIVGNTFRRNAILNPGIGINFTAYIFQFYAIVNYTNSFFYIDKTKNINFAVGLNFIAPQKKNKSTKASYPY